MKPENRILILDDERIVCDRLKPALEKLGFEVETFTDSQKAVERLATARFDVLVTDLKMPGVGGLDVLTYARENCAAMKVIVISGFATSETAKRVMEQGAVEFIPKPFKMRYLRDLIVRISGSPRGDPDPDTDTT